MVLPRFSLGLPISFQPFWKHLLRHTYRHVSWVISKPLNLTMNIDNRTLDEKVSLEPPKVRV